MSDLKPCPFCGSSRIEILPYCKNGLVIQCKSCFFKKEAKVIRFDLEWLEKELVKNWNDRPLENRLKKAIDIMLKAIEFAQDMTFTKTVIRERLKNSRKEAIKILTAHEGGNHVQKKSN